VEQDGAPGSLSGWPARAPRVSGALSPASWDWQGQPLLGFAQAEIAGTDAAAFRNSGPGLAEQVNLLVGELIGGKPSAERHDRETGDTGSACRERRHLRHLEPPIVRDLKHSQPRPHELPCCEPANRPATDGSGAGAALDHVPAEQDLPADDGEIAVFRTSARHITRGNLRGRRLRCLRCHLSLKALSKRPRPDVAAAVAAHSAERGQVLAGVLAHSELPVAEDHLVVTGHGAEKAVHGCSA